MINTTINGQTLQRLRNERKLSQYDLAADCEIDRSLISLLENNKRPAVSLYTVVKLANFFEVTIETLLQ
jgi:transcriptional regulator with XRE-family HTH domain